MSSHLSLVIFVFLASIVWLTINLFSSTSVFKSSILYSTSNIEALKASETYEDWTCPMRILLTHLVAGIER
jgi:hypothetical protein